MTGNYMEEGDISIEMKTTILESSEKDGRMVKEHITTGLETGMKEDGGMVSNTDREHCTDGMETSIQASGMARKDTEKLTMQTELSIRDNGNWVHLLVLS